MASLERSIEHFQSEDWVLVSQTDPLPELRLDVALLPSLIQDARFAFVVVDVLRASTSIVTLLERGVPAVIPAPGGGVRPGGAPPGAPRSPPPPTAPASSTPPRTRPPRWWARWSTARPRR